MKSKTAVASRHGPVPLFAGEAIALDDARKIMVRKAGEQLPRQSDRAETAG